MKKILKIFLPLALSFIVILIFPIDTEFYLSLNKPFLVPPIVFQIVWPVLYLLLGISNYKLDDNGIAETFYYIQLFLNLLWSPIFFYFKNIFLAAIWIVVLIFVVIVFLILAYKKKPIAAFLNIPYLLWLIFAALLNISIFFLN